MIPNNQITSAPLFAPYTVLPSATYNPTKQVVYGGINLNDSSQGRVVIKWVVQYRQNVIQILKDGSSVVEWSYAVPGVSSVSLAFDQNMAPTVGFQIGTTSYMRYYSGVDSSYINRTVSGTTSCQVALDNANVTYDAFSDIIFAYTRNNGLYYTYQRDNYITERYAGPTTKKLYRVGLNASNRLQFGLG